MKTKDIIYYISIVIFLLFFTYLDGFFGLISLITFSLIYSIIFYGFHIIIRKIQKIEKLDYTIFLIIFFKRISLAFTLLFIILFSFSYYQNEINPAQMPEFKISNGKKTVIFQAMSHIGSKDFYEKIRINLTNAKNEGFVYFFEGVKPGTKENNKKFNEAIGIQFDKEIYKNFSKLYGVIHQDNSIYYNIINNLDFNVDIGIDEIIKLYELEKKNVNGKNMVENKQPININTEIVNTLSSLNNNELKVLVYINQAILNFIIKNDKLQETIKNNFANEKLFSVILDGRNKVLADEIINSKYNKIYITYGLLHFNGVLKILKDNDKKWKINNVNFLIPIK